MNRLLPLLLLLSGCATGMWTHPGKTQADFESDKYECQKDGEQYAANLGFNGNPFIFADRFKQCMTVKGYSFVKNPT